MADLIVLFIQDCQYRGLSPATIRDYTAHLKYIEQKLGNPTQLDKQAIKELVLRRLKEGVSPATANHLVRTMKAFHAWLLNENFVPENNMKGLSCVKEPENLKPILPPEIIKSMIRLINDTCYYGSRDKAMIMVCWDTAIRLSGLLNIRVENCDLKYKTIKIVGKGNKEYIVPFGNRTGMAIGKWLYRRGNNTSPLLFCCKNGQRIGDNNFRRTLNTLGKRLGIKVSPHLLRHSAATYLAKTGLPAQHLQHLLGHRNIATTQRYINQVVASEGLQMIYRQFSPGDSI